MLNENQDLTPLAKKALKATLNHEKYYMKYLKKQGILYEDDQEAMNNLSGILNLQEQLEKAIKERKEISPEILGYAQSMENLYQRLASNPNDPKIIISSVKNPPGAPREKYKEYIAPDKLELPKGTSMHVDPKKIKQRETAEKNFWEEIKEGLGELRDDINKTLNEPDQPEFKPGEKVIFSPEGKVYDFGYIGNTGKAIVYNEGENNMQDAHIVSISKLKKVVRKGK